MTRALQSKQFQNPGGYPEREMHSSSSRSSRTVLPLFNIGYIHHVIWSTAKPAERQKTKTIRRWSGKAVRAPTVQIPIRIPAISTDLELSSSTGQCILTALGTMLISLASANETIPLVCAIVEGITLYGHYCFIVKLGNILRSAYRKFSILGKGKEEVPKSLYPYPYETVWNKWY